MRLFSALAALALLALPAHAADKRVWRIDSLIASQKGNTVIIQAKGAVQTGGWKAPRLHVIHSDKTAVTVEFLASPPPAGMTVIEGLVPVEAQARVKLKTRAPAVRVLADANEMTAQLLR